MNTVIPVKSKITDEKVARYVTEKMVVDSSLERNLRIETIALPQGGMISSSDVGAFLAFTAQSIQTKNAIEVGTFTGYTALKVASILPADGKLICCDINTEWTAIGRKYWSQAKVDQKIDLKIAPAQDTLNQLLKDGKGNTFDFAFIDADKKGYETCYELCLKLLRAGGIIVLDNMLWDGEVANPQTTEENAIAVRSLSEKIAKDHRVTFSLLTVGDGLMLVRKK